MLQPFVDAAAAYVCAAAAYVGAAAAYVGVDQVYEYLSPAKLGLGLSLARTIIVATTWARMQGSTGTPL